MPVDVVDYDPAWPQKFAKQRDRLTILLRRWLAEPVDHVGFTAVPGLASNPIVDILAPVTSLVEARASASTLQDDGWLDWPTDPNRAWAVVVPAAPVRYSDPSPLSDPVRRSACSRTAGIS